jgi:hypothetical protein
LTGFFGLMTGIVIEGIEKIAVRNVFLRAVTGFGIWIWALIGGFLVREILLRYVTKEGSLVRCESVAATTVDGPFYFTLHLFKAS